MPTCMVTTALVLHRAPRLYTLLSVPFNSTADSSAARRWPASQSRAHLCFTSQCAISRATAHCIHHALAAESLSFLHAHIIRQKESTRDLESMDFNSCRRGDMF